MQRLAGRTVFTVGTREYGWQDVALAAHLWGEQAGLERRTREGIACRRHLDDLGEALPAAEVEEVADAWRYERDLLSADDMQGWLAERVLEMDEWLEYIHRSVLRTRWSAELENIVKAYDVSTDEVDAAIYSEAVCSGRLTELAERLAGQAAIYDRQADENPRATRCSKAELRPILGKLPRGVRKDERAEILACLQLSVERFIDRIAAPAALEREIEEHPLDWTHLDCETVSFASEETAKEAALLVREDGLSLAKAAAMARSPVQQTEYVLEDVEPALKDRLIGALPGQLIGPLSADGGFVLVWVVDRVEPSTKNRSVRRRARDRLIRRTIQREIARRVRWHERF